METGSAGLKAKKKKKKKIWSDQEPSSSHTLEVNHVFVPRLDISSAVVSFVGHVSAGVCRC